MALRKYTSLMVYYTYVLSRHCHTLSDKNKKQGLLCIGGMIYIHP